MENERTIRRLEEDNAMLKEEISILRDMILDMKYESVKYLFALCSKDALKDISHRGSFPFTFEFLQDSGIDLEYAMDYIDHKKDQIEKETKETEEVSNPLKEFANLLINETKTIYGE